MNGLPLPVALLMKADDFIRSVIARWGAVRDELLFALTADADRAEINARVNAVDPLFPPSSEWFRAGLTPWEASAIDEAALRSGATVLVGGAGAGREIVALSARGYRVLGFDPNEALVRLGDALVRDAGGRACVGEYADVIEFAERNTGRLAGLLQGTHIDCVFMSWGSLSYVPGDQRVRLFRAWRTLAPHAPLITSFPTFPPAPAWQAHGVRGRPFLGRLLWAHARGRWPDPGERFYPRVGFSTHVDSDVLADLAAESGYGVDFIRLPQYAHALLRPARADR